MYATSFILFPTVEPIDFFGGDCLHLLMVFIHGRLFANGLAFNLIFCLAELQGSKKASRKQTRLRKSITQRRLQLYIP